MMMAATATTTKRNDDITTSMNEENIDDCEEEDDDSSCCCSSSFCLLDIKRQTKIHNFVSKVIKEYNRQQKCFFQRNNDNEYYDPYHLASISRSMSMIDVYKARIQAQTDHK